MIELHPVFVGTTNEHEHIVLYRRGNRMYVSVDHDSVEEIPKGSELTWFVDHIASIIRVDIVCPDWKRIAFGNRMDLEEEPVLKLSEEP